MASVLGRHASEYHFILNIIIDESAENKSDEVAENHVQVS